MKRVAKACLFILLGILLFGFLNSKSSETYLFLNPTLKKVVTKSMDGITGRYGIYIKNLKTGETYSSNEKEIFKSGSLYKLWVMEKVFAQLKDGVLKDTDVLSENIDDLNRKFAIAPEDTELTGGTIELTVKDALEQMITISHNYAALLLLDKVGNEGVPTEINASGIGSFFEQLYNKKVIDEDNSNKMLDLLTRQQINDRIPKLLPSGTRIAHKTADLDFFEHDGGIVFSPKGDYIIVVLSESDSPDAAGQRIAELSKAVFDYFNR